MASNTEKEHKSHLRVVFHRLEENGLTINLKKCVFGVKRLEFLGHLVDDKGMQPIRERVTAIQDFSVPRSPKELRRFTGMVNYSNRFLSDAAETMNPLYLLSNKPKRNWSWQIEHQEAFEKIKQALATATMLNHPDPNAILGLTTDSSDFAVGGVFEQFNGRCWEPLGF